MTQFKLIPFEKLQERIATLEARNAALKEALTNIEERADEEMGEWSSVEYAHLPVNMSVFWYLRKEARTAIEANK